MRLCLPTLGCSTLTTLLIGNSRFELEFMSDHCNVLQTLLLPQFSSDFNILRYSRPFWAFLSLEEKSALKNWILVFHEPPIHFSVAHEPVLYCNVLQTLLLPQFSSDFGILWFSRSFWGVLSMEEKSALKNWILVFLGYDFDGSYS